MTSAVLAGIVWMLENPDQGVVEADEMDFRRCLEIQTPYLGPVVGDYTDWTPLPAAPACFRTCVVILGVDAGRRIESWFFWSI